MNRNFKLALAVSLATHVVAFALVRVAMSGEGAVERDVPELPVVLLVSAPEDFIAPRPEAPPVSIVPPLKPESVSVPPTVTAMKPEHATEPIQFTPPQEPKMMEPVSISRSAPEVKIGVTNPPVPILVAMAAPSPPAAQASPGPAPAVEPALITGRVKYRRAPDPEYPALARRRKQEGTVLLEVVIAPDGRAGGVTLKKSSGFPALDRAALEAVPGWEFEVGTAQPVRAEIPVRFQLVK